MNQRSMSVIETYLLYCCTAGTKRSRMQKKAVMKAMLVANATPSVKVYSVPSMMAYY